VELNIRQLWWSRVVMQSRNMVKARGQNPPLPL
jgi:hypothetical protein